VVNEQSDLFRGRQRRDDAIASVTAHAGEAWGDLYAVAVQRWFQSLEIGARFTGESMRHGAQRFGCGKPHHHNAWGGRASSVIRQWLRHGKIREDGLKHAESPKAHARRYPAYLKINT
jgi:hypothetical protein